MIGIVSQSQARRRAMLVAVLCLLAAPRALAATVTPTTESDAALISGCLADPATKERNPLECGERVISACLADNGGSGASAAAQLGCEKRRSDAWALLARQAYRDIEAKLDDAHKRQLRTSEVQFELALRDLCAATRRLGGDPDLAAASCASEVLATRAIVLARLAAGHGSTP